MKRIMYGTHSSSESKEIVCKSFAQMFHFIWSYGYALVLYLGTKCTFPLRAIFSLYFCIYKCRATTVKFRYVSICVFLFSLFWNDCIFEVLLSIYLYALYPMKTCEKYVNRLRHPTKDVQKQP